jgi:hypothetical protein
MLDYPRRMARSELAGSPRLQGTEQVHGLRPYMADHMDKWINAYLAANPEQADGTAGPLGHGT